MEDNNEDNHFKDTNDSTFSSLTDTTLSVELNLYEDGGSDLELQDITDSDSDYSLDDQSEEEQFDNAIHQSVKSHSADTNSCQVLVPLDDTNGDDIDSEEEHDLLKDIKEEIQDMVREEIRDELNVYKMKLATMEQGHFGEASSVKPNNRDAEDGLENLDPKLREAYIKMNKLDRILSKKIKREKEVKRDRILLEKRIREEIAALKPEGRIQKDIQFNTDKFVSLALPASHNEGVEVDTPPISPVFQTQLNEQDFCERKRSSIGSNIAEGSPCPSKASMSTDCTENDKRNKSHRKHHRKNKKKDFIKRNKELASTGENNAMTEDEKKRVLDLLADLDTAAELPEEIAIEEESASQLVSVTPGDGYSPDNTEKDSLTFIDNRLKFLLPEEEYQSLVTISSRTSEQHKCFTRVDVMSAIDNDRYGERALLETKEERDMQVRLKAIEDELAYFHNPGERELDSALLSKYDLNNLLNQCIRSLSRTSCSDSTIDNLTSRSDVSSRQSIMENPPYLSDDVLQKLLAEAQFPLSSRLGALEEENEGSEMEDGENKTISAETWKTIIEQDENLDPIETAEEMYKHSLSRPSQNSPRHSSMLVRPLSNHASDIFDDEDDRPRHSSMLGRPLSNHASDIFDDEDDRPRHSSMLGRPLSNHASEICDDEDDHLVLPEISSSPYLVTQGINNEVTKNEYNSKRNSLITSGRNSLDFVRNNFTDDDSDARSFTSSIFNSRPSSGQSCISFSADMAVPRPPTSERPTSSQGSKSSRSIMSLVSLSSVRDSSPTMRSPTDELT